MWGLDTEVAFELLCKRRGKGVWVAEVGFFFLPDQGLYVMDDQDRFLGHVIRECLVLHAIESIIDSTSGRAVCQHC